jgi:hypothetical protein
VIDINIGSYKDTKNEYMNKKNRSYHGFVDRNYNSFDPLLDYNVECRKCNNYGKIARDCRSSIIKREEYILTKHRKIKQRCGKISKKNKRRKNTDLHFMIKMKGTNGILTMDVQNT